MNIKIVFIHFMVLLSLSSYSQDIESISKSKPIIVTGRIGAGSSYLTDDRNYLDNRLGYNINLGLTLRLYNTITIPVSFIYSDQQTRFNRPTFNRYGLSPSYKWITVHAGYRSYNISPYLLSGSTILGGGIDIKPGKFLLSLFYGNLSHSYNIGYNNKDFSENKIEYYKRKTYGGKIGFGSHSNFFHLSFFKAKDDPLTGDYLKLDSLSLNPKENVGFGAHAALNLFKYVSIRVNAVTSAINENSNAEEIEIEERFRKISKLLLPINESSRYSLAYDASLHIRFSSTNIGLKYQHIDPNYQSLGLIYIQQDYDNYTLNLNTSLFRSKLTFFGNFGIQKNNTKSYFQKSNKRLIANAGINLQPIKTLTISVNYNNFNSNNGIQISEFRDSLRLITNNQGINSHVQYSFGKKENSNKLNFSFSKNTFSILQGEDLINDNTAISYSVGFTKKIKKSGWSFGVSIKQSKYKDNSFKSIKRTGGNLKIRKKIGKKLLISLGSGYSKNYTNTTSDGNVFNLRMTGRYKINKKHTVSFNIGYKRRNTIVLNPFNQTRLSFRYNTYF